jgi:hypothetical protein
VSDNWWTDRQQNKRISGLEDDLSYMTASLSQARASTNKLKAELSKVQGSMEQRLTRLTAAFDAFVELSDLRMTLGLFDEHGRVRHQAKQLLAGALTGDVSDAEGYWLAPALVALRGVADGAVDPEALALATARDPLRARVFHSLLAGVLGGGQPVFAEVLPAVADSVPMYQRAVWLLAAGSSFGPAAWDQCATLLGTHAGESLADTIRAQAAPSTAVTIPKDLDGGGDLATALQACEKLTVLRSWVTTALEGHTGEPGAAVDPVVRRALDLLIDEGSPVELPLLARERELRAVIEGSGKASTDTWDTPVGSAAQLLREDLASDQPGRRALAIRASAPVVLSVAEKFEEAAHTRPPEELTVRTRYGQVKITPAEADRESFDRAIELVDTRAEVDSHHREAMYAAVAVAAGLVVLAILAGWGWFFAAAIAAGVGVSQHLADKKDRARVARDAAEQKEKLREDVANRVEVFAKTKRELLDRQSRVTEDMAALKAALATVAG